MEILTKHKGKILFLIILSLAAVIRLYRIDQYLTFLGDEGRDAIVVYNILHGKLTLLGPTASVGGFFMGPIYYYLMAPFLFLANYNPAGPAVMVVLFALATMILMYRIAREYMTEAAGIIAVLLYAISPLVIVYSRASWNPNVMPFFTFATILSLYYAIVKKNIKLFILTGILLGIDIQLHYIEVFVGVLVVVYVFLSQFVFFNKGKHLSLMNHGRVLAEQYALLFIGFIIGLSPFLAFEARHGFQNIRSIFSFVFQSKDTGASVNFYNTISNVFFRLFGRLVTNFPPPEQIAAGLHPYAPILYWFTLILAVSSIGIFCYQTYLYWKKDNKRAYFYILILLWLGLGVFFFGFYKKQIYDYYFEFMFPVPFLLVGNLISFMYEQKSKLAISRIIAIAILLFLIVFNIKGGPFFYIPNDQLGQTRTIANFVLEKTNNKPFNFALITAGNSDHAYRYFFKLADRDPVVIENSMADPERKSVTDQLLVICEHTCSPLGYPLWEVAGFGRADIAGEWDVSVVKVYKLVHYKGK